MVASGNSPASSHFMTLRRDLALGKFANAFLQLLLLFVQLEIQGSSGHSGAATGRPASMRLMPRILIRT